MEIKGDFLGFDFAGKRSESLGIVRVSGGDRYDENLQPEINDITAEVPGMDGNYYFGSTFGVRNFTINFAFNSLTETQFRKLRKVFGTKKIEPLIFDERPYKKYMVKIANPIELNYVCFDEPLKVETSIEGIRYKEGNTYSTTHTVMRENSSGQTQRIYKGEGTIDFVAYFPYAKSAYKVLPADSEEWADSSGLLTGTQYNGIYDTYLTDGNDETVGTIKVYNPGDVETGFRLYVPFVDEQEQEQEQSEPVSEQEQTAAETHTLNQLTLTYIVDEQNIAELVIDGFTVETTDKGILIDTNTGLITGVLIPPDSSLSNPTYTTSGNLYNQYVSIGNFFKIQPCEINTSTIEITGGSNGIQIFYDYLYF